MVRRAFFAAFVRGDTFSDVCELYSVKIHICNSTNEPNVKRIAGYWRVANIPENNLFILGCVDTKREYAYIKSYKTRPDGLIWEPYYGRDSNAQKECVGHGGKRYLLSDELINGLHNVALAELTNGIENFLKDNNKYLECIINTYEYSCEWNNYTLVYYVHKILDEKYSEWACLRYDYCSDDLKQSKDLLKMNILIICRIKDIKRCREFMETFIGYGVRVGLNLKYRILIIRDDSSIFFERDNCTLYIPFDICNELRLPLPDNVKRLQIGPHLTSDEDRIIQAVLSIILQHGSIRKNDQLYKLLKIISETVENSYKHLLVNNIQDCLEILNALYKATVKQYEQHGIDMNDERLINKGEERDKLHD